MRLAGGMGNQMFQYAAAYAVAKREVRELILDARWLLMDSEDSMHVRRDYSLEVFGLDNAICIGDNLGIEIPYGPETITAAENISSRIRRKLGISGLYIEPKFEYSPIPGNACSPERYLVGFFQSQNYFKDCVDDIRAIFDTSKLISSSGKSLFAEIVSQPSICLNVRRGDFVNNPRSASFHGAMDASYYIEAVKRLRQESGATAVFTFSDDIDWCASELGVINDIQFVGHDFAGLHFGEYLALMSACQYFVIPNSTFGWWAAWLSKAPPQQIIVPKAWFRDSAVDVSDLLPAEWIRM